MHVTSFLCAAWPTCSAAAGAIVQGKAGDIEAAARKNNWPRIRSKRSPQEHVDAVHHHAPHEHLLSVRAVSPASLAKTLNKTTSHGTELMLRLRQSRRSTCARCCLAMQAHAHGAALQCQHVLGEDSPDAGGSRDLLDCKKPQEQNRFTRWCHSGALVQRVRQDLVMPTLQQLETH